MLADAETSVDMRLFQSKSLLTPCAQVRSSGQILAHSGKVEELGTVLHDDLPTSRRQGLKCSYLGQFQKAVVTVSGRAKAREPQFFESVLDAGLKYQAPRQPVAVETYYLILCFLTSES
jgi:hypothetical protein